MLRVRAISLGALAADWDDFAARCNGSWRSTGAQVRFLRWRHIHKSRFVALVVEDVEGSPRRVAQCMVETTGGVRMLYDGLLIAPEDEAMRGEAMLAVLRFLGPGTYSYGWTWSIAPKQEALLARLPGVRIESVRPLIFHAIDFSRWNSWPEYLSSISTNVRRNVKKARENYADLEIQEHRGRAVLRDVPALTRMLKKTAERLGVNDFGPRILLRQILAVTPRSNLAVAMSARGGGAVLAALFGYEFGEQFYYWQGGSISDNGGGSWTLLLHAVERWYKRHPKGKFLMGFFDETMSAVRREGLLRQRSSLRPDEIATSIVRFQWSESDN
ncbi:GNAT family N-acetyltransferase [uncultured Sphingomonas sp.]|uniref:GNAT family N-acetyltransferase n=1 Tax=uncultured Sphingomonas sp. TaxID=158754 RepID=UPI0026251EFF|nr:GNAT family N-acetyltransferase [uncultured Sphingomonas sp.]